MQTFLANETIFLVMDFHNVTVQPDPYAAANARVRDTNPEWVLPTPSRLAMDTFIGVIIFFSMIRNSDARADN